MAYREAATRAALRAGVDPALFHALIQQESGWNPRAESGVGAYGLTQVMPATAKAPGFGVAPLSDRDDTEEQLRFGAEYLAAMLERYGGNVPRALAAYNWGAGNADNWSGKTKDLPEETRNYVASVTGNKSDVPMSGLSLDFADRESHAGLPWYQQAGIGGPREEDKPPVPLWKMMERNDEGVFDKAPAGMLRLPGTGLALNQAGLGNALMALGGAF